VDIFGRNLLTVWPDTKLGDVLRELKTGRSHMALVRDVNSSVEGQDPFYEIKGIITLEDIIEEILGLEIVDETDDFVDGTHSTKVDRAETFEWARLRFLDSKIVDQRLSHEETIAVTAHLSKNYPGVVSLVTERQLHRLIADTPVSMLPASSVEYGERLPKSLLYQKGSPSDICTLILAGKVTVLAGTDDFRSDVSSWTLLGARCLSDSTYVPDFSAFVVSGPCRCLLISRARFAAAVDHSTAERLAPPRPTPGEPLNPAGRILSSTSPSPEALPSDVSAVGEDSLDRKELSRSNMLAALQIGRGEFRNGVVSLGGRVTPPT
jgi:metal transporter CNNM